MACTTLFMGIVFVGGMGNKGGDIMEMLFKRFCMKNWGNLGKFNLDLI